ncbi:MAG: hypothetical protein ACHQM7_00475 [Vicinamibacterales bacterium]|jgi:hypothetical protein
MKSGTRRKRGDLLAAASRLARLIGRDECVLVGGLAVGAHGFVRGTDDLDFISRLPLHRTREILRRAGVATRLLQGDSFEGGFSCLKGELEGIPFDVLPPLVPVAWESTALLTVGSSQLRVVDLAGLLALKFRTGGPQDLLDAARLVLRHPATEPQARELATAYRALDRFEMWLNDPRTRAQAREEARSAKAASRRRPSRTRRRSKPSR